MCLFLSTVLFFCPASSFFLFSLFLILFCPLPLFTFFLSPQYFSFLPFSSLLLLLLFLLYSLLYPTSFLILYPPLLPSPLLSSPSSSLSLSLSFSPSPSHT